MKKSLFLTLALLTAIPSVSAVTFNVRVPSGTQKCYVCGAFNNWDADNAPEMQSQGNDRFTLTLPEVSDVSGGFKYLCGRSWDYVEKDAQGGEISDRISLGNPDVVESWRNIPEWSIISEEVNINGINRAIKVYLPEGYDDTNEYYPVIYYNTVQQRYNNAGDDGDPGDYFFGAKSWNAQATMEELRASQHKAYIMVQICSMLGENTPGENTDFVGTGNAANYLQAFINELMPFVTNNWRVLSTPESTTIVGADYGALFSLYAAMTRPDLFGHCVAMSPMLWINDGIYEELANSATASQTYHITVGALEPGWMIDSAKSLYQALDATQATAYYTEFAGATHNDEAWGASFGSILTSLNTATAPVATGVFTQSAANAPTVTATTGNYTLYAGTDQNNLQQIGRLVYTTEFYKSRSATPQPAYVITNDIPANIKVKYYWNIADENGQWLMSAVKNVGFSSKKDTNSWHNVAVLDDGSIVNVAAHSKAFTVVSGNDKTTMVQAGEYKSRATIAFPGSNKTFSIHYGSVNSASDMGAISPDITVSQNCIEADIVYDFNLNKVTVTETKFGQNLDDISIVSFSALPSVCPAGTPVNVSLNLSEKCDVEIKCTRNFTQTVAINPTKISDVEYSIALNNTSEGIYTFTVDLVNGENRLTNAAEINVRVIPVAEAHNRELTINAYADINWETTGRYKANFHTHTSQSFDTQYTTTEVVDRYKNAGYSILALTDHDANSYPWDFFSLYNPAATDRNAAEMGMLAIPGIELSKDRRNSWSEQTGGEFNHHNDFFTGRKGQEFMSLRESYAYTQAIGGMQIINHPGQYWNLSNSYTPGSKNSPEWHAENFRLYNSLIGLEVYNQGNRRPNDRILWDQILTINMPERPVWGYSCDDTHTSEQYFRNYQFMLMDNLNVDALKDAMQSGKTVFSYEYTGSGEDKAPHIKSIAVDHDNSTITIDSDDANRIEWIYSTHRTTESQPSTTKSTVVGLGKTFNFADYNGSYVRARLVNDKGETATQPFGFTIKSSSVEIVNADTQATNLKVTFDESSRQIAVECTECMTRISIVNMGGSIVKFINNVNAQSVTFDGSELAPGVYVVVAATDNAAYTDKFAVN